jgi:hypothetical protein
MAREDRREMENPQGKKRKREKGQGKTVPLNRSQMDIDEGNYSLCYP